MHVRRKKLVANRSRSGADRFSAAITSEQGRLPIESRMAFLSVFLMVLSNCASRGQMYAPTSETSSAGKQKITPIQTDCATAPDRQISTSTITSSVGIRRIRNSRTPCLKLSLNDAQKLRTTPPQEETQNQSQEEILTENQEEILIRSQEEISTENQEKTSKRNQ